MHKQHLLGIGVLIVLIAVGFWFLSARKSSAPSTTGTQGTDGVTDVLAEDARTFVGTDATTGLSASDTTAAIGSDLQALELGDIDTQFQELDADLQAL